MNINNTLINFLNEEKPLKVHDSDDNLNKKLITFLKSNMGEKQSQAESLVKEIMEHHKKGDLAKHTGELYAVESATASLTGKRDHVIHAINTFILGLFINNKYLNNEVDLFQWKLTALFHDIAYPLEISQKIINRYFEKIKSIKNNLQSDVQEPSFNLVPKDFEKLTNNISAFDLLQNRIAEWKLNIDVHNKFDEMVQNNRIDHGIISALTVLYLIDLMYQKNNPERKHLDYSGWTQENFEKDIVNSSVAIFLHNLYLTDFFENSKNKSKLVYLLKLSDELQNWDRPNNDNSNGDSPENYDIIVSNNKLVFSVKTKYLKKKILGNIECLKDLSIVFKQVD